MNRAQRRQQLFNKQKGKPMQKMENMPLTMAHGFTATHIVINFSMPVTQLGLTPVEARALVAAVQGGLEQQAAANAKAAN